MDGFAFMCQDGIEEHEGSISGFDPPFHMNGAILFMLQTKTKSTGESHVVHIVVLPLVVQ
jgi:hypothetical protein